MKSISIMFFLVFFASCATVPKRQEMEKEIAKYQLPNEAKPNEGTIYVLRPSGLGGLVRFNIHVGDDEIDTNEIGWTRGNQRLAFYLPEGKYRIASVAENTAEMYVEVKAGEKVFIKQDPTMGFFFARNSIFPIDEVEGTYWYMKTEDGTYKRVRIEP